MFGQGGEEMNLPGKGLPFAKMHGNGNDFVVIDNRYGDIPVSYTHLDVYKRQVLGNVNRGSEKQGDRRREAVDRKGKARSKISVSYTHLDVYKRQVSNFGTG